MKPYGFVQFCDDIRHERGDKVTLVGVYQNEMVLDEIPAIIPRLGISINLVMEPVDQAVPLTVEFGNMKVVGEGKVAFQKDDLPEEIKTRTITSHVVFSPLEVPAEGVMAVKAEFGGKPVTIGQIYIRQAKRKKASSTDKNKKS